MVRGARRTIATCGEPGVEGVLSRCPGVVVPGGAARESLELYRAVRSALLRPLEAERVLGGLEAAAGFLLREPEVLVAACVYAACQARGVAGVGLRELGGPLGYGRGELVRALRVVVACGPLGGG